MTLTSLQDLRIDIVLVHSFKDISFPQNFSHPKKTLQSAKMAVVQEVECPVFWDSAGFDSLEEFLPVVFQGPGQSKQESGNTNNSGNHGVINYNFYNQQWQNSVDLEHAMEQNATSYGGAGGGDSAHTNNRHENLLLSGLQAATTILPLLADGLTEDFENSDRVSSVQSGTSTLVTQHFVGTKTYRPGVARNEPSSTADEPTEGGPSVKRFTTLTVGEWTSPKAVYHGWSVPLPYSVLMQNTPFAALARRHYILKCGWHVQVQVNSTRFHGGALGVFLIPDFVDNTQTQEKGVRNFHPHEVEVENYQAQFCPQALFLYPHQIINPRTNSSAEIQVPYASHLPASMPNLHCPWTLLVVVLSPLTYANGATTSLTITASIRPMDPSFHGLRQTNSEFQGLPKNRNEASSYGFVTTQAHYAEPAYGAMIRSSPSFVPGKFEDLLQVARVPTLTQARAVSFSQTVPADPLITLNVALAATDLLNTTLETVSRGFAQYRGSLVVQCLYVGNQMQNVRYVCAYTPPGADAPANLEQAMQATYTIYDTGLNAGSNFVIPFISPYDYRYVNSTVDGPATSGGYFTIWQLTALAVPPGSPPTAELLVYVAAGEDFEFRCPTTPWLQLQGEETQVSPAETGVTPALTAANTNEEPTAIPYGPARISHSAVRFWFDRYFLCYQFTGYTVMTLNQVFLHQNIPEIVRFMHAQYYRFELELMFTTPSDSSAQARMYITYYPPGSLVPSEGASVISGLRNNLLHHGPCPQIIWDTLKTPCLTYRIPFTSPAATFPLVTTSFATFGYTNWNQSQGINFGAIVVDQPRGAIKPVLVYMRMVDLEVYCPKPGFYVAPSTRERHPLRLPHGELVDNLDDDEGATNFSLLKLAGDVEENPGPTFSKVYKLFRDPEFDQMFDSFVEFKNFWCKIKDFSSWGQVFEDGLKSKFLKKVMKCIAYGVIILRAAKDPLMVAAVAYLCAGDWIQELARKCVKMLTQFARTQAPPFPVLFQKKKARKQAKRRNGDDTDSSDDDDDVDGGSTTVLQTKVEKVLPTPKQCRETGGSASYYLASDSTGEKTTEPLAKESVLQKFESLFNSFTSKTDVKPQLLPTTKPELIQRCSKKVVKTVELDYPEECNPFSDGYAGDSSQSDDEPMDLSSKKIRMQGVTKFLSGANQLVLLCKNAGWISEQIQKVLDWLGIWKKQEEEASIEHFNKKMEDFPRMVEMQHKYGQCPKSPQFKECKAYFDEMRRLAVGHDPRFCSLFPVMEIPDYEATRPEPVLVVLKGLPGQGKSVAAALLAKMLAHELSGTSAYYAYNSQLKYMDGYNQQEVVVIDDLGQNPAGEDFSLFCQLISTTTCQVNKADLKDKGMAFTSSVIIATTNLQEFRPTTISDPAALKRRINFDLVVEAGASCKTRHSTLDLAAALKPDPSSPSPLPCFRHYCPLLSSAGLVFRESGRNSGVMSLVDVYTRVLAMVQQRNSVGVDLSQLLTFQGKTPKKTENEIKKVFLRAKGDNSEGSDDRLVYKFLTTYCDSKILDAYCQHFYGTPGGGKKDDGKFKKFLDIISAMVLVLTFVLMLCSFGLLIWEMFNLEGAYGAEEQKRKVDRSKLIKLVDLQGPVNMDMEKAIAKHNTVHMTLTHVDGSTTDATGLFVKDRWLIMNYHLYQRSKVINPDFPFEKEKVAAFRPNIQGVPSDIVILDLNAQPGRKYRSIVDSFISKDTKLQTGNIITGVNMTETCPFIWSGRLLGVMRKIHSWDGTLPQVAKYQAQTAAGFCGSPVMVDFGIGKKILGIHSAGGHGIGVASVIFKEQLQTVIGEEKIQFQGKIKDVVPHPYVYTPKKTAFKPTVAFNENTTVAPAALSPNDKRLEKPEEFKKTIMEKHTGNRMNGPWGMVKAAREYARLVRAICGPVNGRLTVEEAVEGTIGLDPMDMTRSPGWPYLGAGKRRRDLYQHEGDKVVLDPTLQAELMNMLSGNYTHHKFVTFLKDELRPLDKVKKGKTRVIDIASFGHAIVGRILFGKLASQMHLNNGVELGSAVGTNPEIDWTRYAYEFKYKHFVDIDYSGFDSTHTSWSFYCLKIFLKELGFDEVALRYVDSLCVSRHIWDDEEYTIEGGLPSGCSCTSIFNTIMNNIVVRAAMEWVGTDFQMLAYGDDLVLCANEPFDMTAYKQWFDEMTNYKITPASKSGDFIWTNLQGVVFLKRRFKPDGAVWRPVMDVQNLHNILSWAREGTIQEKLRRDRKSVV